MKNLENEIKANQNFNGGGLATEITGKFESNRNALAKLDSSKRTAGQVALSLRKKGHEIYVKEIKSLFTEWHHAGVLPKQYGGGMKKVYYTSKTDNEILNDYIALKEDERVKKETLITGFYWVWAQDYNGNRYGKKRNYKVCHYYEGSELDKPKKNFTPCTQGQFDNSELYDGQEFFGWSEPNL